MLPVRPAALPFWHGVALPPDDLTAEEPARITEGNDQPVRQGEQVAVAEPRLVSVEECPALVPGLDASRGIGRYPNLFRAQRAGGVVLHPPLDPVGFSRAPVEPQ